MWLISVVNINLIFFIECSGVMFDEELWDCVFGGLYIIIDIIGMFMLFCIEVKKFWINVFNLFFLLVDLRIWKKFLFVVYFFSCFVVFLRFDFSLLSIVIVILVFLWFFKVCWILGICLLYFVMKFCSIFIFCLFFWCWLYMFFKVIIVVISFDIDIGEVMLWVGELKWDFN